jgi:formamidopyrimidine-DNA glycosylase
MPELPEVETIAAGLRELVVGRTISRVAVHWPRTVAFPSVGDFQARLAGRRILSVGRRGKYLMLGLDAGTLLLHLKMSGRLAVVPAQEPLDSHTRLVFDLDDGRQLRFRDARKFGRVYLVEDPAQVTAELGPEPLSVDFTALDFQHLLSRRKGRLKSLLLNQSFVAGLGNIYADEVLFAARLHPLRRADSLTLEEQEALYGAIRAVLGRAVRGRGTTLDDGGYRDVDGQAGAFQDEIAVYGRKGKPCPRCGTPIQRIVVGGRSAHFCPACQAE